MRRRRKRGQVEEEGMEDADSVCVCV